MILIFVIRYFKIKYKLSTKKENNKALKEIRTNDKDNKHKTYIHDKKKTDSDIDDEIKKQEEEKEITQRVKHAYYERLRFQN